MRDDAREKDIFYQISVINITFINKKTYYLEVMEIISHDSLIKRNKELLQFKTPHDCADGLTCKLKALWNSPLKSHRKNMMRRSETNKTARNT